MEIFKNLIKKLSGHSAAKEELADSSDSKQPLLEATCGVPIEPASGTIVQPNAQTGLAHQLLDDFFNDLEKGTNAGNAQVPTPTTDTSQIIKKNHDKSR
ncbi:MAG: hypothetical protein GY804_15290 [Alphaproteobacteria bacterium]|nr:hypothetical protein [Alphaproteobacteria bacterium]